MSLSSSMNDVTLPPQPHADAVVAVLLFIQSNLSWSASKVATRLKLPVVAVEEATRTGQSSALLKAQFLQWVHETGEVPSEISPHLIAKAIQQCERSPLGIEGGGGGLGDDPDDEAPAIALLEPKLKDHFAFLQQSVGYNFMSILNDPLELDASTQGKSGWGSWISSVVSDAFDHGISAVDEAPQSSMLLRGAGRPEESSSALLAQHLITPEVFAGYQKYISETLQLRKEAALEFTRSSVTVHEGGASQGLVDERHPWPSDLDSRFFDPSADAWKGILDEVALPWVAEVSGSSSQPSKAQDKECLTQSLEAVDAACDDLQERLMDVERCLFTHVQRKSDDFFVASTQFRELHLDAQLALTDLAHTRDDVLVCGDALISEFVTIARLHRRKESFDGVCQVTQVMKRVLDLWDFVESWIVTEARSIESAPMVARVLMECQAIVFGDDSASTIFSDLTCLRSLPVKVTRAKSQLLAIISSAAVSALQETLRCCIEETLFPVGESKRHATSGQPIDWAIVTAPIDAVCTLGGLTAVLQQFQQSVLDSLWIRTRSSYVKALSEGLDQMSVGEKKRDEILASISKVAVSAQHSRDDRKTLMAPVKPFRPNVYATLLNKVLIDAQETVCAVAEHWHTVREHALSIWREHHTVAPPPALDTVPFFMLLHTAAQHCVMDLITVREGENMMLRIHDATPMLRSVFHFVTALENILEVDAAKEKHYQQQSKEGPAVGHRDTTGKNAPHNSVVGGGPLRGVLVGQCRSIFKFQHEKLQERVLQAVACEEQWTPVAVVDPIFQAMVTQLCTRDESAVAAFHQLTVDSQREVPNPVNRGLTVKQLSANDVNAIVAIDDDSDCAGATKLYIVDDDDNRRLLDDAETPPLVPNGFTVGHSLLLLLQTLTEYRGLLGMFPFLAFDIIGKMYEALKLYDGQCAAMILGASAVDQGVLASISALHLALASQCIACLAELTPRLQRQLLLLFPSDKLGTFIQKDFDRIERELSEHRNEFLLKLASLVRDKIDEGSFDPLHWANKGNGWIMTMLREAAKLLKTIRPILRRQELKGVMIPVIGTCAIRIKEAGFVLLRAAKADEKLHSARLQFLSDVLLFKMNTEKFGFDAIRCLVLILAHATMASLLGEKEHPLEGSWRSIDAFNIELFGEGTL